MRYSVLMLVLLLVLAGCNRNTVREQSSPSPNDHQQVKVQQTQKRASRNIANPQTVANRLEQLAVSVPQVRKATCVVIGNTAVVGIDVQGNLDRSRVGTIKYSVAEALRKDPNGANALVTADMDLYHRLRDLRNSINRGKPVAGFANEMADIIGRIMPQLPQNVNPLNNPPANTEDRSKLKNRSL
ncbi:YhcN/YlaJ family sporulation lipoprotein [Ferviditalea candida]|uniref:YhcN/YlaJ family sporulation lipoprotein n=1 Tax=Ferviditalea candida TaxID=3108399 RepID=A0ABU5ZDV6_9BACL|nr:YhcN/YlaJ family sporulation lipoprotein [Paenibacillaceae bacterium T2]